MCRYPVLWTVVLGYVPLSDSMGRRAGLCAVIWFYGPPPPSYVPSIRTIDIYIILFDSMVREHFSIGRYDLCAFISVYGPSSPFYVPSFWSMDRHLILCAFISVYEPLFDSMCLHFGLWTVISVLCAIVNPHYESSPPLHNLSSAHCSFSRHPASNR